MRRSNINSSLNLLFKISIETERERVNVAPSMKRDLACIIDECDTLLPKVSSWLIFLFMDVIYIRSLRSADQPLMIFLKEVFTLF